MEKYLFVFFIFLLLLLLVVINHKFRKSRYDIEEVINKKEKRLLKLYNSLEELMGGAEEYIEEAKREIDKKIEYFNSTALQLTFMVNGQEKDENSEKAPEAKKADTANTDEEYQTVEQKVWQLKNSGMDEETIARELMLSRGEVSLILKINGHAATK